MREYDYIQGERFIDLHNGVNIIYCKTENVNEFLKSNKLNNDFILISHNSDGKITDNPTKYDADINLIPNNLIKWYGQNVCIKHDKVSSIPIGLENSQWFKDIGKIEKMKNIKNTEKK
jgi:hypothetical protein